MISEELDDLLSLLAMMIFADKKVVRSEVETFMSAANHLQVLRDIDPRISEPRLLAWFNTNKASLIKILNSNGFEAWLKSVLDSVSSLKDKTAILNVMNQISLADGEVHVSEKALMVFSARYWGIDLK